MMSRNKAQIRTRQAPAHLRSEDCRVLSEAILRHVNSGISRIEFLQELVKVVLNYSECDAVELRVRREDQCFRCEATRRAVQPVSLEVTRCGPQEKDSLLAGARKGNDVDELCQMIVGKRSRRLTQSLTKGGSFWTGDLRRSLPLVLRRERGAGTRAVRGAGRCHSLAVIPLTVADETIGLLQLRSRKKDFFREFDIDCYESIAQTMATALVSQLAHASLRERIKELTCLYSLAQLVERPGIQLEGILRGTVELLPAAWQYPEIAAARIVFDGRSYATARFDHCVQKQSVDLAVKDQHRGGIEVGYTQERPELDEGPFLKEERSLIDTVARQIALLVERREAAEDRGRLQDQLRHADRLATIGQLSAGVAHELNEPLSNILAFAQLAGKEPGVPRQVSEDLGKIVRTSLHAREIIKKLMLFARQMPPRKTRVNLNAVIEEGLYFLESRCSKEGVAVQRRLAADLPEIVADPSQLNQVLVNLVVNALQAMPKGGTLTIATHAAGSHVVLTVEDTGVGMAEEILGRIFTPFFTTKSIHEGTGLGLPVVHGIVVSHGGMISVHSTLGQGSQFEIRLPLTGQDQDKERVSNEIAP